MAHTQGEYDDIVGSNPSGVGNASRLLALCGMRCTLCCSVVQCVTVCCSALQCVAVCCSGDDHIIGSNPRGVGNALRLLVLCGTRCTLCCSVLQCVVVLGSVLQCVAVRCCVLQLYDDIIGSNPSGVGNASRLLALCGTRCTLCCSVLRWVAVGCSVSQCVAVGTMISSGAIQAVLVARHVCWRYVETLQHDMHIVLQCVAVCCSVLQCVAVCCSVLQCVAICILQCVVMCAFQCAAVCCSVFIASAGTMWWTRILMNICTCTYT